MRETGSSVYTDLQIHIKYNPEGQKSMRVNAPIVHLESKYWQVTGW